MPQEPKSFRAAGLNDSLVESLALKHLLARGDSTGREVADQLKLPFILLDELLRGLKNDQLVVYRAGAPMNDFLYQLTDLGRERAKRYWSHCTYFGAAPVSLEDYIESVKAQSLATQPTTAEHLRRAFGDLVLSQRMLDRLGPAVNSGRGLFLFGAAGNGKTSIAERVTRAFGQEIWIPRAIGIDGEIMRVFDPASHEELPLEACDGLYDKRKIDRRWVRIRRPTLIVGGELTMSALEVTMNTSTGICESPLQLKSNCGTLVIDDFGRQRMRIEELLNRWIVPLERRYDFLNMPNGKKIQVPFDQLIIFSTNLEPRDLVDEAFLRRIPYKIEVLDPSLEEFKGLFRSLAKKMGFPDRPEAVEHLIAAALPAEEPALPLLPSPRPPHADPQLLQLQGLPAGDHRRVPRHGGGELFRRDVTRYFTTKFTIFPGTTIVFTTVLPASSSAIFSSARAAASMAAWSAPAATTIRPRSLPLICTGISIVSSLSRASSNSGQGS